MRLKFIPPSDHELIDAYEFYENQFSGLGDQFLYEVNTIFKLILEHPMIWKKVGKRTRRALLKRFPYLILYIIEENTIFITCIAHQHRNPEDYLDRIV